MPNPPSLDLLDRLRALLGPKGFTAEAEAMEPWLVDWRGRYRGSAAAMLSPGTSAEAAAIVRLCADEGVALVPQGGNTSMVAGATPDSSGASLLLSLRRLNRIREVDPAANVAVCEAGVILADLHAAAAAANRRFPLSLGAKGSATIGGLVSTNAGGTQVLRFGTMRGLVLGIEAVLPDGSIHSALAPLRKDNRGYDLKQLLIGAEGTLGVVTAASLRLVPMPGSTAIAWAGLASPQAALALLRRLEGALGESVESFELVPDEALRLVLAHVEGTRAPLAGAAPWNVLIEATAPTSARDAREALEEALGAALEAGLIGDAVIAASEAQGAALWRLRETISEAERHQGPAAKHDVSVPVSAMPEFIEAAGDKVMARFPGTRVVAFGHLGDGNVHFNVLAPAGEGGERWLEERADEVSAFVHDLVGERGGSISAEHGIGQMKRLELVRTLPPARLAVLQALKRTLDPAGIMNPGKLLA
ncbi:MAG TPA: FAD-binding oxidoreductase [Allosphingosinicella sp.]